MVLDGAGWCWMVLECAGSLRWMVLEDVGGCWRRAPDKGAVECGSM